MADAPKPAKKSFDSNRKNSNRKNSNLKNSIVKNSNRKNAASAGSRNDRSSSQPRSRDGASSGVRRTPNGNKFKRDDARPRRSPRIEPEISPDIEAKMLPGKVRAELLSLSAENAEVVAKQMVMMERLLVSNDPKDLQLAHEFALAASNRAGRVGVVRNLAGRAALANKDFAEAKRHLSAALRISGSPISKILLAESEVGLGKPRKALELLGEISTAQLSKREKVQAHLISAEARELLGQLDAARVTLAQSLEGFLREATQDEDPDHEVVKLSERWFTLKKRLHTA